MGEPMPHDDCGWMKDRTGNSEIIQDAWNLLSSVSTPGWSLGEVQGAIKNVLELLGQIKCPDCGSEVGSWD